MQDEIEFFENRLAVTLGSQVQYDSDSGAGVQPTARVMWKPRSGQRLWAATSRALRTPSLTDQGIRLVYPPVPTDSGLPLIVTLQGNPSAETETLVDAEAGYRVEIGTAASIDVTGFVGRYDHLRTQEPAAPVVQFVPSPRILVRRSSATARGHDRGLEVAGQWAPVGSGASTAATRPSIVSAAARGRGSQDPLAGRRTAAPPTRSGSCARCCSPGSRATLRRRDSSTSVRSSSSGGRLHARRRQGGMAVQPRAVGRGDRPEPVRRRARRVRRRRTRCSWPRKSRAASACSCAGRPARESAGQSGRDR